VPGTTVRIKEETRAVLRELAKQAHEPMQETLAKAVETYRRQQFLEQASAAYAALRADPEAWRGELEERALWDTTLPDGLEDE
jgi:hypothetical protein